MHLCCLGPGRSREEAEKAPWFSLHLGPLLPAGSCQLPLCLDTASTKICAAWPLSANTEMLVDFYIAPRRARGSRWTRGTQNATLPGAMKLGWPTDGAFGNGLWGCRATASLRRGFYGSRRRDLLSSAQDGSARLSPEGGANPTECAGGVAPFPGSLSGLGQ